MTAITNSTSLEFNGQIIEIENPQVFKWSNVYADIQHNIPNKKNYIIKLNLVKTTKHKLYFNVIYLEGFNGFIEEPFLPNVSAGFPPLAEKPSNLGDISCLIVPTGIGAAFGGYAGDANPLAKVFAKNCKYLLTHPNVVNGAVLSDLPENIIYLEGFLLDQFLLGKIGLVPNCKNKIGVVFDKGIEDERLDYEVNVLNAMRAFYGCEIVGWAVTEKPVIITPEINEYGFSSGKITNLEYVIEKALKLKELGATGTCSGATAIAICCAIPDIELNKDYISGIGIDPIGGIESIISHTVSAAIGLVSAHAPVLISNEKIDYKKISPVSASEFIAQTFLPSVISGLRYAPQIVGVNQRVYPDKSIKFLDLANIILPYNAFGSASILYLSEYFKNIFLIRENKTCLDVDPSHLNIDFKILDRYIELIDKEKIKEQGIDKNVLRRPLEKLIRI